MAIGVRSRQRDELILGLSPPITAPISDLSVTIFIQASALLASNVSDKLFVLTILNVELGVDLFAASLLRPDGVFWSLIAYLASVI